MILKRVQLDNYTQHQHLDIKITGTLVALIGPNGRGKSNLLGAIQYGLTGEHPGKTKEQLLKWGATQGSVTIDFENEGVAATITRSVSSATAELQYGTETFRGVTAVAEALKVHLGLDRDLVRQAVFVRQAEIDTILFTTARERELAFQRLLGIGEAAKIHKTLGDVIAELSTPVNYDDQISAGKQRYSELHTRLSNLQAQLDTITTNRGRAPAVQDIQGKLTHAATALSMAERTHYKGGQAHEQTARAAKALIALNAAPSTTLHDTDTPDLASLDARIQELQAELNIVDRYSQALQSWQTTGEALIALGASPYAPEELQAAKTSYNDVTASINRLAGKNKLHDDMLVALGKSEGLKECPVCGSAIENTAVLVERLRGILDGIKIELVPLKVTQTESLAVCRKVETALSSFQQQYNACVAAYQHADKAIKALLPAPTGTHAMVEYGLVRARELRRAFLDSAAARNSLEAEWKIHAAAADRMQREYYDDLVLLSTLCPEVTEGTEARIAETLRARIKILEEQRAGLQKMDTDIAQLSGVVGELTGSTRELDNAIATLEFKRAGQQKQKDVLEIVGRAREWFHFSNGPHTLAASVLETLTQDVNGFLGQFTAPFVVEPSSETLGFRVIFTDGRETPAGAPPEAIVLSGGERVQLAVAFRLAAYCMFAGKLGLLSLDEPTNFLDSDNVSRFGEVLQKIKRVAQGMNLQLLVATHEASVIPFCDTVIDLTPK